MKRAGFVIAAVAAAAVGLSAPAGAAAHRVPFLQAQKQLEAALSARLTQLNTLTADVKAATNLSDSTSGALNASLSLETANITALSLKVPNDATYAELKADRNSMIHGNRVYAVMTPQVHDSIEAANDTEAATDLQGSESQLGAGIQTRRGSPGWKLAWREFTNMSVDVAQANVALDVVTPLVLAQAPQGFPGNERAFVNADRHLLNAEILLAKATYDRSVIQLFIDGYAATS